jgi:hypothetical protein
MSDDIVAIIKELQSKDIGESENARQKLPIVLKHEIERALLNMNTATFFGCVAPIYTIYKEQSPKDPENPIYSRESGYKKRETQIEYWDWVGVRIKAFNTEIDFFSPFFMLVEEFRKAILEHLFFGDILTDEKKEKAEKLYKGLKKSEFEDRKKWIRYNFDLILNNKTFNNERNSYKVKKRAAEKSLNETIKKQDRRDTFKLLKSFENELPGINEIAFAICAIYMHEQIDNPRKEFPDHEKWIDENKDTECFNKHLHELIENASDIENIKIERIKKDITHIKDKIIGTLIDKQYDLVIPQNRSDIESKFSAENNDAWFNDIEELMNMQKLHYYWKNTDDPVWEQTLKHICRFSDHILDGNKKEVTFIQNNQMEILDIPKKPVENKEFCTWLMHCSGFSQKELACMWKNSEPTISRWLTHPKLLKLPFIDMDFPPVYFSSDIREQINKIQKNWLWPIYKFLMNKHAPDVIDRIAQGAATGVPLNFDFELIDRNEIDEISVYTREKLLCQIVGITQLNPNKGE